MLIFLIRFYHHQYNNIDKEKLNGLYNEIVNTLIDDIDKDKVNSFVSELCNFLIDSAKTTFGTLSVLVYDNFVEQLYTHN
jgi:hypothetical protein